MRLNSIFILVAKSLVRGKIYLSAVDFKNLSISNKIIFVLKSHENFGGPQSTEMLKKTLDVKRKNLDSALSKLALKGSIIRIEKGVYKYPGDERKPRQ